MVPLYSHTTAPVVLIIAFVALIAGAFKMFFSRKSEVYDYLQKIPRKAIGDFKNGDHGKIVGRALIIGNYFEAPLSRRRCTYYRIVVEQYHRGRRGLGYWYTIIDDEEAADVVMTDGKHYAVVLAKDARCYLVPDRKYSSGFMKDAAPRLKEFLSWHERSSEDWIGMNRRLRYSEGVLEHNEKFVVSGVGEWRDAKEFEFDLPCKRVLVLKPDVREKVHLSDDKATVHSDQRVK